MVIFDPYKNDKNIIGKTFGQNIFFLFSKISLGAKPVAQGVFPPAEMKKNWEHLVAFKRL